MPKAWVLWPHANKTVTPASSVFYVGERGTGHYDSFNSKAGEYYRGR